MIGLTTQKIQRRNNFISYTKTENSKWIHQIHLPKRLLTPAPKLSIPPIKTKAWTQLTLLNTMTSFQVTRITPHQFIANIYKVFKEEFIAEAYLIELKPIIDLVLTHNREDLEKINPLYYKIRRELFVTPPIVLFTTLD